MYTTPLEISYSGFRGCSYHPWMPEFIIQTVSEKVNKQDSGENNEMEMIQIDSTLVLLDGDHDIPTESSLNFNSRLK